MNRIDRLTALLVHLQSKSLVPMDELEERFEVSRRTLFRDIRSLVEAGVPIGGDAAEGYGIVKGYHLPPVVFNKQEAAAILLGAKMIEQTADQQTAKAFKEALYKIKAVLKYADRDFLESLENNISIIANRQIAEHGFPDSHLTEIQQSIGSGNVLQINYLANYNDQTTDRLVEPLGLVFYSNRWHLIAYCRLRKDFRDFRTDRIKKIEITSESFDSRQYPNYLSFLHDMLQGTDVKEAVIRFEKQVTRFISDQKYLHGFIDEKSFGKYVEMRFATPYYPDLARWLMMFGSSATVVSPNELKDLLWKFSEELHEHLKKEMVET